MAKTTYQDTRGDTVSFSLNKHGRIMLTTREVMGNYTDIEVPVDVFLKMAAHVARMAANNS